MPLDSSNPPASRPVEALIAFCQHKDGCEKKPRGFEFRSNGCKRCYGTGSVPADDCDDCADCQMTCPDCQGRQPERLCTCGLEAALLAARATPAETVKTMTEAEIRREVHDKISVARGGEDYSARMARAQAEDFLVQMVLDAQRATLAERLEMSDVKRTSAQDVYGNDQAPAAAVTGVCHYCGQSERQRTAGDADERTDCCSYGRHFTSDSGAENGWEVAAVPAEGSAPQDRKSCPCQFLPPCKPSCTCANPILSGGCQRCCKYGSHDQQRRAAEAMVAREVAHAEGIAPQEIQRYQAVYKSGISVAKAPPEKNSDSYCQIWPAAAGEWVRWSDVATLLRSGRRRGRI